MGRSEFYPYSPPARTSGPTTHWPSVIQFTLSLLAFFALFSFSMLLAGVGLVQIFNMNIQVYETTPIFLLSAGIGLCALLTLPSAWYAVLRMVGRPAVEPGGWARVTKSLTRPWVLVVLIAAAVLLGDRAWRMTELDWLLLPPLHVLAVGLPVMLLAYLGWRGLPTGSLQRAWGVFASGLVLGPLLILLAELFAGAILAALVVIYVATQPELAQELLALAERLEQLVETPEEALLLLSPYLAQPAVVYTIFSFTAGIVPLIEELIKPIGVWLLAGRKLSPAEGFSAGALSGAGFALFENLAFTATGGEWTAAVVLRMGTGLLHIVTGSLTGWALALAWSHGRYLRLVLIFLGAVLLHSLWNGLALLTASTILTLPAPFDPEILAMISGIGLIVITFLSLALLLWLNHALRKDEHLLAA